LRDIAGRIQLRSLFAALALGVLAIAAISASTTAPGRAEAKDKRPNVLVIMSDDESTPQMSVMPKTNELIGDHGETFKHFFVSFPLCCPSRSTYLTGQYSHNNGVFGNGPPEGGFTKLDSTSTLPVWLQNNGYYTGQVGKYLNGYGNPLTKNLVPQGWSEWYGAVGSVQQVYGYNLNENGTIVHYGTAPEDYKGSVITSKALSFIQRRAPSSQPFFLTVDYTAPHSGGPNPNPQPPSDCQGTTKPAPQDADAFANTPLPQPPSFNEADVSDKPAAIRNLPLLDAKDISDITRFYRCRLEALLGVDRGVDTLMQALKASGELKNTLVIYTSDNGFFHGEHRIKTGKNKLYEEANSDPLLMRGPGIPKGRNVNDIVVNADLAPTILDATGTKPGRVEDGRSLLTYAKKPTAKRGRALLFEVGYGEGVRTSRYDYIERQTGEKELYDLQKDPYELQNLAGDTGHAVVQAALAKDLAGLETCAGQSCRGKPDLKLKLKAPKRGCAPRSVKAIVKGRDRGQLDEVDFLIDGKDVGTRGRKPFKKRLSHKKLRRHRRADVRATAHTIDGRVLTLDRSVRACR
jgi:N-acetylglucosamine-6-sulfatase